jgi:hypothetical protein
VLSYDPGELYPVNRLIEVKLAMPPSMEFLVTRDEWEKAQKFGSAYLVHV